MNMEMGLKPAEIYHSARHEMASVIERMHSESKLFDGLLEGLPVTWKMGNLSSTWTIGSSTVRLELRQDDEVWVEIRYRKGVFFLHVPDPHKFASKVPLGVLAMLGLVYQVEVATAEVAG